MNQLEASSEPGFSFNRLNQNLGKGLRELRKKIWWILAIAVIAGIVAAAMAYTTVPTYTATLSFVVDEENKAAARSEFSIFSEQLGLAPVNGGYFFSSAGNIMELINSRLIIERTLRKPIGSGKKNLLLAEYFLDSLGYGEKFNKDKPPFVFTSSDKSLDSLTAINENGMLGVIHQTILSKHLSIQAGAKQSNLIKISCSSESQLFSKIFLESLINEVSTYYTAIKTERAQKNLAILQQRTDSTRNAYIALVRNRATFSDADINLVRQQAAAPGEKKQTDVQIIRDAYIELSGSLENAKTVLMNNTPLFQVLDRPTYPLKMSRPNAIKWFVLSAVVAAFLVTAFFLGRILYRFLLLHF